MGSTSKLRRSTRTRTVNTRFDEYELALRGSESNMGDAVTSPMRVATEPDPETVDSEAGDLEQDDIRGTPARIDFSRSVRRPDAKILRKFDGELETARRIAGQVIKLRDRGKLHMDTSKDLIERLVELSLGIEDIAEKFNLDDTRRGYAEACVTEAYQLADARDELIKRPRSPPRAQHAPAAPYNLPPDPREAEFVFRRPIQFDKVLTDPVDYLGWKDGYRQALIRAGNVREEDHLRALKDSITAAVPETDHGFFAMFQTTGELIRALDDRYGDSAKIEEALCDRIDRLPDVRYAEWEEVQKMIFELTRIRNSARLIDQHFANAGDTAIENDIFNRCNYKTLRAKLCQPIVDLLNRQNSGFDNTRRFKPASRKWQELFDVLAQERVTLKTDIEAASANRRKTAGKTPANPSARSAVKAINYVPVKDRKPKYCPVCDEDSHSFFAKECRSAGGKNKKAADILKKKKFCLRCIRPESECQKGQKDCDGTYKDRKGVIRVTDCGKGCKNADKPINRKICGHPARQIEEKANGDNETTELHVKVVNLTQPCRDGSAMIDRITVGRRDGSQYEIDVQYDGGSMGTFITPDPENEQYRTGVKVESMKVVFADNSSTFLESPSLFQVPIHTKEGTVEYLECVELQVFGPGPMKAYKMPRKLSAISQGKLVKQDRFPKILIGTNHSDLYPHPAKHSGALPKGFRVWESLMSGRWFLTGCPNYLPTPTVNCTKITAKAWGALERNFQRMVEAETEEPPNLTRRREMTAEYAQDLLKQSLTLAPDRTQWEVRYHYDGDKLAKLQPNREVALRRMISQLKRVSKDAQVAAHLNSATAKNIDRRVWIRIEEADFEPGIQQHFLPIGYHANENSVSTPYRIITDSSCKDAGGLSLNDCQLKGTNKIGNLRDIVMRFRLAPYAAVGDISAFYHCYQLCKPDQSLRRIFVPSDWADPSAPLIEMCEASMPFGDTNAGALAVLGRIQNAEMHIETIPEALRARVLTIYSRATYIDDVIAYGNTPADLDDTIAALEKIAKNASYAFKEWFRSGDTGSTKVLGYEWDPEQDAIAVKSQFNIGRRVRGQKVEDNITVESVNSIFEGEITKRNAVSLNGQLYDPMQIFGPLSIKMRLATSRINLATGHNDWSAIVPDDLKEEMRAALLEAMKVVGFTIPRRLHPLEAPDAKGSLIVFCDGSLSAYGAVAYWRPGPLDQKSTGRIIASSAGTCLRKKITAPRSELMGAVKAAQLYTSYEETLSEFLQMEHVFFFSDSEVVLNQLKLHSGSFNLFTGTRLQLIKDSTPADSWYHVPTAWNPADLLTRDSATFEDVSGDFWLNGAFIGRPADEWPHRKLTKQLDEVPDVEVRGRVALIRGQPATEVCIFDRVLRRFGYLKKAVYTVMCVINFVRRTRRQPADATYQDALRLLLQRDPIQEEKPPKLTGYHTLRQDGILVVRSRTFENQPVCYLPVLKSTSALGQLILRDIHNRFGHGRSDRYVAAVLVEKFFVIAARRALRKIRIHCPTCKRLDPTPCQTDIAPLPASRTEPCRPFTHLVGDVFGPMAVYSEVNRRTQMKVWVLLVVCQFTRAIHLYLLRDYSTDALIVALTDHLSHHGAFRTFWSDCGTNLKGAGRILEEANPTPFDNANGLRRAFPEVKWMYGPPASPWCQGAAEVMIREVKKTLRANSIVEGSTRLTMMDLSHLLHKVTITLNSRPLVTGPEVGDVLTPAMLTYGTQLKMPEIDLSSSLTQRSRWVQKAFQEWWGRFCTSADLRRSYKFADRSDVLQEGDIVLILDQPSPNKWYKLGKVDAVLNERRVIVEMANGKKLERHIKTLSKLVDTPRVPPSQ